ncbi:hypothetical protein LCGC14_1125690 [marine sediment metagenome]|uniref:Uncharacterized protein n=1 Tax=marine sediment metagenome TaxID=412755 RepID=A0A0F9PKP1_9ZZZZ
MSHSTHVGFNCPVIPLAATASSKSLLRRGSEYRLAWAPRCPANLAVGVGQSCTTSDARIREPLSIVTHFHAFPTPIAAASATTATRFPRCIGSSSMKWLIPIRRARFIRAKAGKAMM